MLTSLVLPIILLLCICNCLGRALYPYWEAFRKYQKEEGCKRREYNSPEERQRDAEREAQLSFVESWPGAGKFSHLPVLQYREHLPR